MSFAKVLLIDHGIVKTMPETRLYALPHRSTFYEQQTTMCKLYGVITFTELFHRLHAGYKLNYLAWHKVQDKRPLEPERGFGVQAAVFWKKVVIQIGF